MARQQQGRYWRDMVHWKMFLGYLDPAKELVTGEDVHHWLRDVPDWKGIVPRGQYLRDLGAEVNRYLTLQWKLPKVNDLNVWIKKGMWMRGRSGDGRKT